jgi:TNF receptor-associated factor 4
VDRGCDWEGTVGTVTQHVVESCIYAREDCKYKSIGCNERPMRKDVKEHEEDDKLHLSLALGVVKEIKEKPFVLNQGSALTFKLPRFSSDKIEDMYFFSPSFYTHPGGYHMVVRVDTRGYGDGEGTHISVCTMVREGDFDKALSWPFRGVITYILLNQLNDKLHIRYIADLTQPKHHQDINMRPGAAGTGIGRYVPYSKLDYNPVNETQYLKDDALYFRVSVDVPDHKPWLDCTADE